MHILFLSCRTRFSTDYDRLTLISPFHLNPLFTISSYNTLGSKLVHKQRQCLVLSQDQLHCTAITLTFTSRSKEATGAGSAYHLVYFYTEMLSGCTCSDLVLIGGHRTTTAPRSQRHECVVGAFQLAHLTKDGATRTLRPMCSTTRRLTIKEAPPPYAPPRILFFLPEKKNIYICAFSWFISVFPDDFWKSRPTQVTMSYPAYFPTNR